MSDLVTTQLLRLFRPFPVLKYCKGETLIRSEDPPLGIYYIYSGYVRMYSLLADGRELTLNIFRPGAYFPMIWAITSSPNIYYYQALTEVRLRRAPKNLVLSYLQSHPDALFVLTQRILTGLDSLLSRLQHLFSGSASARVATALHICALRFGSPYRSSVLIRLPLTHQDIAHLSGLTRETTSIELKKLEKEGLLARRRRLLVVKSLSRLESKFQV
ncbi:hypothetical protein A2634_02545 [Candidatus Amesbacteria bacterium RIFCSPHIGHO2_01_FULL_48_32]|uniref:HTH crp-type domain-containing protein n=1 Tax=Candidatus Amesbacteria bacterium RIFCSPLOWO2_01_FULL_48_25 TaxID=1797259 RepID=A0A1F4ZDI0_9BACT|nr:MAG: hypothetical protein A2634_02545 [Candidatus Amesbacteria bacterium RIFCSPHIGHO2_01_FULL_48_32]OGD04459.1 MAG: hypothetical protein A2989_05540 [Candidatus Amesbacteria bacterium RIFCSPLOWO2_01_FULL_48_25]HJZ06308.1 Crp/Fnr family transcriptional regulator [Patescibacteria group bacterium]